MNARRLGKVHVGLQALLLILGHDLGIEVVIEVAGNDVGIGRVGPRASRHGQATLPGDTMNPFRELLRERTFSHLTADLPHLGGLKRVVEPGQQSSQSESHCNVPYFGF